MIEQNESIKTAIKNELDKMREILDDERRSCINYPRLLSYFFLYIFYTLRHQTG